MPTTQAETISSDLLAFVKQEDIALAAKGSASDKSQKLLTGWHDQISVGGKCLRRTKPAGIQSN
jgi:hypothetical protein